MILSTTNFKLNLKNSCNNFRAFSIHSQACEAGITDVQRSQVDQESSPRNRRRTVSIPTVLTASPNAANYQTFNESSSNGSKNSNDQIDEACCDDEDQTSKSSLRDFLVVLALTFHAVLEGIAVGLEGELNDVWLLFAGTYSDSNLNNAFQKSKFLGNS